MWKPYLKVIAKKAGQAIHVLDRFHIMQKMNKAIDEVRAGEARQMKADGYEPILKHSRWCLLKRRENLTEKQTVKLSELLKYNLQSVRAHLLREDFQRFWEYVESRLGREVPRPMVYADDAKPTRTDEEGGSHVAQPSRVDSQLVSGERGTFVWHCRGFQQQSKTDHQKIVRLSHLRSR